MTTVQTLLLLIVELIPIVGVITAAFGSVSISSSSSADIVGRIVRYSLWGSAIASLCLLGALNNSLKLQTLHSIDVTFASVFDWNQPMSLMNTWGLSAVPISAIWCFFTSVMTLCVLRFLSEELRVESILLIAAGHVAAVSFVLSNSVIQMFVCWQSILLVVWLFIILSVDDDRSKSTANRMIWTSFVTDIFLAIGLLKLCDECQTTSISDIVSSEGLEILAERPEAITGFLGSVIVLSILGRAGLFPFFGWNDGAENWTKSVRKIVYFTFFVPSSIWLAIRFEPLIRASETSANLLRDIGCLGAVLGSIVACCQTNRKVSTGFLITAECGVIFSAIACGIMDLTQPTMASLNPIGLGRIAIGQLAVIFGLFACVLSSRDFRSLPSVSSGTERLSTVGRPHGGHATGSFQSITPLFERKLHVDHAARISILRPLEKIARLTEWIQKWVDLILVPWVLERFPVWCAHQFDSITETGISFQFASSILAIATLLLTVFLVT
ncbi:MAG: hypothetical protein FJ267_01455 [Planctomycetes bacterium]|nr:hypothetical protein [Planctomycetota bacterium]